MRNNTNITLVGNPNCGKTAVFNLLTGMNQKVSNYPGTTVSSKQSKVKIAGNIFNIVDLPGTYSIVPETIDEKIVTKHLFEINANPNNQIIVCVVDSNNNIQL